MRYMGIDYGTKRVGTAFSDESGTMAFPHAVLERSDKLAEELAEIIEREKIGAIVIGHSLGRENEPNPVQREIEALIGDLTLRAGIPIHLEPEQYTTQEAMRIQGKTGKTDASAAAIILNSFLTKQSRS